MQGRQSQQPIHQQTSVLQLSSLTETFLKNEFLWKLKTPGSSLAKQEKQNKAKNQTPQNFKKPKHAFQVPTKYIL